MFSEHGKVYNSNPEINNMCCYSFIRSVDFLKTQLVASRATIFFGEWIRLRAELNSAILLELASGQDGSECRMRRVL